MKRAHSIPSHLINMDVVFFSSFLSLSILLFFSSPGLSLFFFVYFIFVGSRVCTCTNKLRGKQNDKGSRKRIRRTLKSYCINKNKGGQYSLV